RRARRGVDEPAGPPLRRDHRRARGRRCARGLDRRAPALPCPSPRPPPLRARSRAGTGELGAGAVGGGPRRHPAAAGRGRGGGRGVAERHGALLAEHGLEPFLEAALTGVAGIEDQIASLEGFSLCHGDLCATNILWAGTDAASSDPRVQYIDFEWAQGDDPARDLAIIGGRVHGGPW